MGKHSADPSHPRYKSLLMRQRLELAAKKGMLADSAMIAHGRGEAFDYLLGEVTIPPAMAATREVAARLLGANNPIISLNGNAIALAGKELLQIANLLKCPVEVNIFYRTDKRMKALISELEQIKNQLGLDVEILGSNPNAKIPNLEGPRSNCCEEGIIRSDVILVPLEDGDRCEALVAMGKDVLVIDLNPLSRTAKMASVTIVDELSRVAVNLLSIIPENPNISEWNNDDNLDSSVLHILNSFSK
jgi:4-phosphopantoate--beta-alanine ligase